MKWLAAVLAMALAGTGLPRAREKNSAGVKEFALTDAQGRKHTNQAWKNRKAVVLIFLGTECPVSNGYSPEYRRLFKTYSGKDVLFFGIHPDPDVSGAIAAQHAAEYRLPFPVLLDPSQNVAKQAQVKVVPEGVVLSATGQILYRGRIDDLYNTKGNRREEPMTRDLEEALKAVLAGRAPPVAVTQAFGCPLPQPVKGAKGTRRP